jgi:hypothetical protein
VGSYYLPQSELRHVAQCPWPNSECWYSADHHRISESTTSRDLLRPKGSPYDELGLDDPKLTDDQLIDAMLANPILINRPIVVTPFGVKLCRPSEIVLEILPAPQRGAFTKEDGEKVVDDQGRPTRGANR